LGVPFFEMRFRYAFPKVKFTKDIWTHFKAMSALFESIWTHSNRISPPLILISNKKAVRFLNESQYKWTGMSEKEKSSMFFWMDTLKPDIRHYDPLMPPFSALREAMLEENQHVTDLIAGQKFFDYKEFAVDKTEEVVLSSS
jgi:hypothetical protein